MKARLDAADAAVKVHPATALARRLEELQRIFEAWAGFSFSLSRLLARCERHEPTIVELVIRNIGDTSGKERIKLALDQAAVAYVAALGALIDHNRIVLKGQSEQLQEEYANRLESIHRGCTRLVISR